MHLHQSDIRSVKTFALIVVTCILISTVNSHVGIKFTVDKQHNWVLTTYLAILLDWVVYSSSKIVLEVWNLRTFMCGIHFLKSGKVDCVARMEQGRHKRLYVARME